MNSLPGSDYGSVLEKFIIGLASENQFLVDALSENKKILEGILSDQAWKEAGSQEAGVFMPAPDLPGYVLLIEEPIRAYVPFYMVELIPPSQILSQIKEVAIEVKLGQSGNIALSGSSVYLGGLVAVGDLDFSEYYCDDVKDIPPKISDLLCKNCDIFPVKIYPVGQSPRKTFTPPWSGCPEELSQFLAVDRSILPQS